MNTSFISIIINKIVEKNDIYKIEKEEKINERIEKKWEI